MEYISAKEAARRWGIDPSRIGKFARDGRIEGAKIVGRNWLIPANATKPADGRTKIAKESPSDACFRFPLFVNFPEDSFVPPLTPKEAALRRAQVAFYSCDFERAKKAFKPLSQNAESIYVKICALFFMCVISVIQNEGKELKLYYGNMRGLLSADFPYRQEMSLFLPLFDFNIARFYDVAEKLKDSYTHEYHPSSMYMSVFLSVFKLMSDNSDENDIQLVEPYTALARLAERDGYYVEAQKLHLILFLAYYSVHNEELIRYHMKKALDIAYKHNLIYTAADAEGYYADAIEPLLAGYPEPFATRFRNAGKAISDGFARFSEKTDLLIYSRLSKNDYRFIIYATMRYSNKQIAHLCGISERSVANKYNDIYNKLGVNSKQELLREIELEAGGARVKPNK